ncbi:unnamed protein product [Bursaphelenchus xylophilus]|uniref:(pine wood nematode) hypothetical protein n=1 Tax=Bursaphelenchus xylophilus TaxID=6326 RepID=A0A1I7SAR1_BURXY|nr:unnamed protein product [Bursaphelenchus xylophilus]CAG9126869.1 unnamed protein product [Bursaphelenchus xylophilus]
MFVLNGNSEAALLDDMKLNSVPYKENYCVIYNYISPNMTYNGSVTFVTHSDVHYLGNLETLTRYWDGPISIGIIVDPPQQNAWRSKGFASKKFVMALSRLDLLSASVLVGKVTAHLVYPKSETSPCGRILVDESVFSKDINYIGRYFPGNHKRHRYPINVLRNVARIGLTSPIFMSSELEEIPSAHFAERVKDLALNEFSRNSKTALIYRKFQIAKGQVVPQIKSDLIHMFNVERAAEFKNYTTTKAHRIPMVQEWMTVPENFNKSSVFMNLTYMDPTWEPRFVGYNRTVPLYDDSFILGLRDQTELVYEMCLNGFEFKVLNDLFTSTVGIQQQMSSEELNILKNGAGSEHGMLVEEYTKRLSKQFPDLNERCGIFKADDQFYYHVN